MKTYLLLQLYNTCYYYKKIFKKMSRCESVQMRICPVSEEVLIYLIIRYKLATWPCSNKITTTQKSKFRKINIKSLPTLLNSENHPPTSLFVCDRRITGKKLESPFKVIRQCSSLSCATYAWHRRFSYVGFIWCFLILIKKTD